MALALKILFGVLYIKTDTLFTLNNQPHVRGHNYTLKKLLCASQTTFFSTRVVNIWNSLLADTTDFSSLHRFCASVSKD